MTLSEVTRDLKRGEWFTNPEFRRTRITIDDNGLYVLQIGEGDPQNFYVRSADVLRDDWYKIS